MTSEDAYHRFILPHNRDEFEKVAASNEVWGQEAAVLAGGICVQAYPGCHPAGAKAYSFGCAIPPRKKLGFIGKKSVIREVFWTLDMEGVKERGGGKFAAIPILWCKR